MKHAGVLRFITESIEKKDPCLLVAPQCPGDDNWVPTYFGLSWINDPSTAKTPGGPSPALERVMEMLDNLQKVFSIDPDRRYVTGLSMGGYGSFDLCRHRPDWAAAAAPVCGGADPEDAAKMAHVPFWVFHGGSDPAVPVELSRDMVAALKAAGAEPKYTEYPGVGHDSWKLAYKEPGLVDWMLGQRRARR